MLFDPTVPPMRAAMRASDASKHRFRVGAAIAKGNKVLVKAHNTPKTHPQGSGRYSTLHAEAHAINKAVRQGISLEGTTIYVYRANNNLAKPCPCCQGLIHKHGIKKVVYSDSDYNKT